MEKKLGFNEFYFLGFLLALVFGMVFVSAIGWVGEPWLESNSGTEDLGLEGEVSSIVFNLSEVISYNEEELPLRFEFAEGGEQNITSLLYGSNNPSFYYWISLNSVTGILEINSTNDNQTGSFKIPLDVFNKNDQGVGARTFNFTINATNDIPEFSQIQSNYSFPNASQEDYEIIVVDEEEHYPLNFTIDYIDNCTHAEWSGINDNTQCDVFNFENTSTNIASLGFDYNSSFVGNYWAVINVSEASHDCPHSYCDENYTDIHTLSQVVQIDVLSTLELNISDCDGLELTEGDWLNCSISVRTVNADDNVTISSYAYFENGFSNNIENRSWIYSEKEIKASSFFNQTNISILLDKTHVGNWTINITANDGESPEVIESINVFVNWTESPANFSTVSPSYYLFFENGTVPFTANDYDLKIPDKDLRKEQFSFTSNVSWVTFPSLALNYWDLVRESVSSNLNVNYDLGGNDSLSDGCGFGVNCSVLINLTDLFGNNDNFTILVEFSNNSGAEWNDSKDYNFMINEDDSFYLNLTDGYVWDIDNDGLTFSFVSDSSFDNFSLTSEGIINFTPDDVDVGYHNVTINASDGKVNSLHNFNFTILNIPDEPSINHLPDVYATEDTLKTGVFLSIIDDDFLIPVGQKSFYNESLSLNITFNNLTVVEVPINYSYSFLSWAAGNEIRYSASFTPNNSHVGDYNVTVNVTDESGNFDVGYYLLSINETNDMPVMDNILNYSFTIYDTFYLDINSTDEEEDLKDSPDSGLLNYTLDSLISGGEFLTIDPLTGEINLTLNSTYEGVWHYNVTVNDTDGGVDFQDFWLYVYGVPELLNPVEADIFNLTENTYGWINLTLNHSVGDELTLEFWIDAITCGYQNSSDCNYSNFSLRSLDSYFGNSSESSFNFRPNYTDETYGNLKNMTVTVYPNNSELNITQLESLKTNFSFKLNISHLNHVPEIHSGFGPLFNTSGESSPIQINLIDHIRDYDYLDSYYNESVNFTITSNATNSIVRAEVYSVDNRLPWNGTIENWTLELYGESVGTNHIRIMANDSESGVLSSPFSVSYVAPTVVETPTPSPSKSSSGTTTQIKHYSLKVIAPQDVIISDDNYIEVPFSVQNNGQLDLVGINLSSYVRFNNLFSDDIKISLNDAYLPLLKFGQTENFTLRIAANTQKSGKYKATIYANVTSPKFSDWGDFFIDLRRVNESEAEQILIFTEKMIADNPECLELTENLKSAQETFLSGDSMAAYSLAQKVIESCEDAIEANDQITYPLTGFVEENFFYILSITLGVFLLGFIIYIYKRVRFNKSRINDYI